MSSKMKGRGNLGGILRDNLVARVIASQKLPRDSGESKRALRGIKMSRRALWVYLEAQQRYFSYRAMLVAIVSQNFFVLVLVGFRTSIARYVAKRGIAQMCLCELSTQGGYRTILGEC